MRAVRLIEDRERERERERESERERVEEGGMSEGRQTH